MKALTQTFLAGVAGALTVGVLIAAAGPLTLRNDGIQFPDGSLQTSAPFGFDNVANAAVNLRCQVLSGDFGATQMTVSCGDPVPPGTVLVVEHVSANLGVDEFANGCDLRAFLHTDGTGTSAVHALKLETEAVAGGFLQLNTNTPMRVYFRYPEQPYFRVFRTCEDHFWFATFFLTGYYVDSTQ